MLSRQVTAALDRWRILPDDSAGRPLALSAPGRLLRHVVHLFGKRLTSETLLTLLKHPLTASGADRGTHLLFTRDLELKLRRKGPPFFDPADLRLWAASLKNPGVVPWAEWLIATLGDIELIGAQSMAAHVAQHVTITEALAAGPMGTGTGGLWLEKAG